MSFVFKRLLTIFFFLLATIPNVIASQKLIAVHAQQAPIIDGKPDAQWSQARQITTRDRVADIDITIKAIYTIDQIFFLVSFPDPSENREHKTLLWDKKAEKYKTGPKREDTFVFKWSMEPLPVDMALSAGVLHKADIWYWKAKRTDHANHADDKLQTLSDQHLPGAQTIIADNGQIYFLKRQGDAGQSAYRQVTHKTYIGDEVPGLMPRTPDGSRADVQARGIWSDGRWTIEFSRHLDTGHYDDLIFDPAQTYSFGVSRYEIAGRPHNPAIEIPDYGSGDIGEILSLKFLQ